MFVSNTATAAMMLTFLTPVFRQLPPEGKGRISLALSIPVAANLGGMGTPIGTPPNTIAIKYLNDPEGMNLNIGFGEWMLYMTPLVIVLLILSWFVLKRIFPFTQKTIELHIEGEMKKDDLEEINWSVIWMVAGGFALGYALNGSGLAERAVESIPFGNFSPILIMVLSGLVCYGLSNFISNSATAALLMPILTVVCAAMGDKLDAIGGTSTILIGVAIAASSAMVLPISTPPNALAYATNLVQQKHMAKIGLISGILSIILGYVMLYVIGTMHLI